MFEWFMYPTVHQDAPLTPQDAAQVASLEAVHGHLVADARSWAAQVGELSVLAARAEQVGAQTRRTLALELAGSWRIGQLTAERWVAEAERFHEALPLTLELLGAGELLRHQASVLLHRTASCTPQVARAVEAEVLPAAAELCTSDLARRVDRVRLRIESEQRDPAEAERQQAERVAARRTWVRPDEDGMAVAGALLTAEQGMAWAAGMDALERRDRLADRAVGSARTAEQRRADLFASLPALVLAGTAQDDAFRRRAGVSGGRMVAPHRGDPEPSQEAHESALPPWTLGAGQVAAQVVLHVHVPVSIVLELGAEPGSLDRYGWVSAEHVRLMRPTSFRRVLVEASTGRPVAVDDRATPADPSPITRREQVQAMLRPDVVVDADEPQHDPPRGWPDWSTERRALLRPWLLLQHVRPRPPRPLPSRSDQRAQPRPDLAPLPQRQAPRLDPAAPSRRQRHLAQPPAPALRPPGPVGPATARRPVGRPAALSTSTAGRRHRRPPPRRVHPTQRPASGATDAPRAPGRSAVLRRLRP